MSGAGPAVEVRSGHLPAGAPALMVHGGAWAIPVDETEAHVRGLRHAASRGAQMLTDGAPALDVVVAVVTALEADGTFDAGRGAVLNRDGEARLDAGVMCGATGRWGAVAHTLRVAHPARVARRLLDADGQARLLVADGAERFAAETGEALVDNAVLRHPREVERHLGLREAERFHTSGAFSGPGGPPGTVGAVALDAAGRLAACTSTGGAPYTRAGRVGDSPLVGSGYFASEGAAASATGWGEAIAAVILSGRAVDAIDAGVRPEAAAARGLAGMAARVHGPDGPGTGGLIALDRAGRGGWAFSTPRMARAGWRAGGDVWTLL